MSTYVARLALLFGNFVVGVSVVLPAGMLKELSVGLGVSISQAGLLVTFGAVVLCFGSPLMAWWTTRIDRRVLLAGTLLVLALGHAASALAVRYSVLLALRLGMLAVAAIFTPQAASTVALIVPEGDRPSAIAFVFLGWSLAVAAGLPTVTYTAAHFGWHVVYGGVAVTAGGCALFLYFALPAGLRGTAVSLRSWARIAHHRVILLLLLLTAVLVSGQFALFTYLAPFLSKIAHAHAGTVGAFFAAFGIAGFLGNVLATRIVRSLKPYRTTWVFLLSLLFGLMWWTFGSGSIPLMATGVAFWGLGFASINSMQQARLVGAAPDLASASVALNTSSIYVGQAVGSALGGVLFGRGLLMAMNYAAIVFVLAGVGVLTLTRPRAPRSNLADDST